MAAIFYTYFMFIMLYTGWTLWVFAGILKMIRRMPLEKTGSMLSVTVVVAVRNEATKIEGHLAQMKRITAENDKVSVIYVNDHSQDDTGKILRSKIKEGERIQIIDQEKGRHGKKKAILTGIENTGAEWICTTDADCTYPENWLKYIENYCYEKVEMIAGPVELTEHTLFQRIQNLEYRALMAIGMGTWGNGVATMCSGANLWFKRASFYELGGYEGNLEQASGDDEFLYHKFHKRDPESVMYCTNHKAVVRADAENGMKAFLDQRTRWASKGGAYKNKGIRLIQLISGLYFLMPLLLIISSAITYSAFIASDEFFMPDLFFFYLIGAVFVYMGHKSICDSALIFSVNNVFGKFRFQDVLRAEVFQFIYVPIVIARHILKRYDWKGRKY